ncbi:MAG: endolytic transglycosylase MltG [Elusimicrobiaceae bacterium]|nr:endolytic transglycosylase MltG [Elusimicrobiaceae bacterium]
MKKIIFLSILGFLIIGGVAGYFFVRHYLTHEGVPVTVEIPKGTSPKQIAEILKSKGVIKSTIVFRVWVKMSGADKILRSGTFDLNKDISSIKAIWHLVNDSGTPTYRVTILEGWRLEEIADELFKQGILTEKETFLNEAKRIKAEGFLFPSTYKLPKNMPPLEVLRVMYDEYEKNILPIINTDENTINLNEQEIVTLASIVEREAVYNDERPKIAAVYLNRLKIGKRLEADPTVQYALGYNENEQRHWKKGLTYTDLKFDSPYNTYRYAGLPPAPIASPGANSVKAVLNPTPDFEALYFVADNTGRHIFSTTYHQHLETIKAIRGK